MKHIRAIAVAWLMAVMVLPFSVAHASQGVSDGSDPFTPEGNLTLVDDVFTGDEGKKQFITAVSKNGNYFYLVIDRSGDDDNVYLLNMIDEADLLALMEDEPEQTPEPEVEKPQEPEEPEPEEPEPEEPEEEPEVEQPQPDEKKGNILPLLLAMMSLGGVGYYYFTTKIKPKGEQTTSMSNPDDEEQSF